MKEVLEAPVPEKGGVEISYKTGHSYFLSDVLHRQVTYEIYCLLAGSKKVEIGSETYSIGNGDMLIIPPGVEHRTINIPGRVSERVIVSFDEEFIAPLRYLCGADGIIETVFSKPKKISISGSDRVNFDIVFSALKNELQKGRAEYIFMVRAMMAELIVYLFRAIGADEEQQRKKSRGNYDEIIRYIDKHFEGEINLALLSEQFYMNPSVMARGFKRATNMTVTEYINQKRIDRAKELLEKEDFTVQEISELVGYNNVTYFSRIFKKLTDIAPSQFRNNIRKSQ